MQNYRVKEVPYSEIEGGDILHLEKISPISYEKIDLHA
jgi:hypothetical protein